MNLRGKKENIGESTPLTDKTNTFNDARRKKKQNSIVSDTKTTNKGKPKTARKTSIANKSAKPVKRSKAVAPPRSPECFGFNDSDLFDEQPPYKGELTEFDCSKPFRLALYVRPSKTIRVAPNILEHIQKLNPLLNLTNATINNTLAEPQATTASSPNRTLFKAPFASTPKDKPKGKLHQMKITDVFQSPKRTRSKNDDQNFKSYFENSETSDEERIATPPVKIAKKRAKEDVSTAQERKAVADTTGQDIPVTFRKPNRRSYVKKSRPPLEPEDTTPTEEILETIEKANKKGKPKRAAKDEEEFEKWSRSMNSMFEEVDQFEISILD